jgi:hypothetical protein
MRVQRPARSHPTLSPRLSPTSRSRFSGRAEASGFEGFPVGASANCRLEIFWVPPRPFGETLRFGQNGELLSECDFNPIDPQQRPRPFWPLTALSDPSLMLATQSQPTFVDFLTNRLALAEHDLPVPGEWADAGNTIGMLALRMNLLSVEQIDHILEMQEREGNIRRFGELAESLGLLSHSQVSRLLAVQTLNRELELGERLVMEGRLEIGELVKHLSQFINGKNA